MRTLQNYFEEYAISHQNPTNKLIHYLCVPAIFFSIVGLIMVIPGFFLKGFTKGIAPFIENWAFLVLIFVVLFYLRLSKLVAFKIAVFSLVCLVLNYFISQHVSLWFFSLIVFAIAWLGQFWGHSIEGKKPSFLKDVQFLLIGPAWVISNLFSKKNPLDR
jgi:uncharacterized membrane protein YGL010W